MSQVLHNYLGIEEKYFESLNFVEYLPDFGGYTSSRINANKIMKVKDWLRLFIPIDEDYFESEGPSYVQEILFPLPIKALINKKQTKEFLHLCFLGSYRGLRMYFDFLAMEYHHVNQTQEKLVYVPKDFHKGYHNLLHSDKNYQKPLPNQERKRYEKNRKKFLKFVGDAVLSVLIHQGESVGFSIKELYFTDKLLDKFVFDYSKYELKDSKVHQFIYCLYNDN